MKTIKVSESSGLVLDWLVAKAEGATNLSFDTVATWWVTLDGKDRALRRGWAQAYLPSSDWAHGGPILDRERITFDYHVCNPCDQEDAVHARLSRARMKPDGTASWYAHKRGPTLLIAAMRCFVASKLGDTDEIPEDL